MTYPQRILTNRLSEIVELLVKLQKNTLDWRRVDIYRRETEQALIALALIAKPNDVDQYSNLNEIGV